MPLTIRIQTIGLEELDIFPIKTQVMLTAHATVPMPMLPPDVIAFTPIPFLTPTLVLS